MLAIMGHLIQSYASLDAFGEAPGPSIDAAIDAAIKDALHRTL